MSSQNSDLRGSREVHDLLISPATNACLRKWFPSSEPRIQQQYTYCRTDDIAEAYINAFIEYLMNPRSSLGCRLTQYFPRMKIFWISSPSSFGIELDALNERRWRHCSIPEFMLYTRDFKHKNRSTRVVGSSWDPYILRRLPRSRDIAIWMCPRSWYLLVPKERLWRMIPLDLFLQYTNFV